MLSHKDNRLRFAIWNARGEGARHVFDRRTFVKGAAAAGVALATPSIVRAQQTTLKVVWMGWPDNQVLPLFAEFERVPSIKLAV